MMKHSHTDKAMAQWLKQGALQPSANDQFTQRVLHRLPPANGKYSIMAKVCFALAFITLFVSWVVLFPHTGDDMVITVRSILCLGLAIAISAWVATRMTIDWIQSLS